MFHQPGVASDGQGPGGFDSGLSARIMMVSGNVAVARLALEVPTNWNYSIPPTTPPPTLGT